MPEGHQQVGEMVSQEPHKVSLGEVQNLAPGVEQPQAPVHAGVHSAGKQHCSKGQEGPGRHQVEHKLAMGP